MEYKPLLSICIPTYNRNTRVCALVLSILKSDCDIEVCVHVDGSSDNSFENLQLIIDSRLRVSFSENRGRARALFSAVAMASGKYVMIFDDDDWLGAEDIASIISDCHLLLPEGCAGFIYHMKDDKGRQVGRDFPVSRSNFLALRADHAVTGDKKEIVVTDFLKSAMEFPLQRRVPTSLYWSIIANKYDVICRNVCIGEKTYLDGGMTSRIRALKLKNPKPLVLLYHAHMKGYFKSRYKSPRFFFRALLGWIFYSIVSEISGLVRLVKAN